MKRKDKGRIDGSNKARWCNKRHGALNCTACMCCALHCITAWKCSIVHCIIAWTCSIVHYITAWKCSIVNCITAWKCSTVHYITAWTCSIMTAYPTNLECLFLCEFYRHPLCIPFTAISWMLSAKHTGHQTNRNHKKMEHVHWIKFVRYRSWVLFTIADEWSGKGLFIKSALTTRDKDTEEDNQKCENGLQKRKNQNIIEFDRIREFICTYLDPTLLIIVAPDTPPPKPAAWKK